MADPILQCKKLWLKFWEFANTSYDVYVQAGKLGLPLMIAIIGGETHRFKPLVDMYVIGSIFR